MVSGVGLPVKPAATLAIRRGTMLTLITAIGTLPTRYNFESILCMKDKRSGRFDAKKMRLLAIPITSPTRGKHLLGRRSPLREQHLDSVAAGLVGELFSPELYRRSIFMPQCLRSTLLYPA